MSCQFKPREGDGSAAARGKLTEGDVEDEEGVGVANWRWARSPEARHLAGVAAARGGVEARRGAGIEVGKRGREDERRREGEERPQKLPILLG